MLNVFFSKNYIFVFHKVVSDYDYFKVKSGAREHFPSFMENY